MNSADTAAVLRVLQAAYPSSEVTEEIALLWANAFESAQAQAVKAAVEQWVMTEEWWPSPAAIVEVMRLRRAQAEREQSMALSHTRREDPADPIVSLSVGLAVAAEAYEADCKTRGVEPDWDRWHYMMGGRK